MYSHEQYKLNCESHLLIGDNHWELCLLYSLETHKTSVSSTDVKLVGPLDPQH